MSSIVGLVIQFIVWITKKIQNVDNYSHSCKGIIYLYQVLVELTRGLPRPPLPFSLSPMASRWPTHLKLVLKPYQDSYLSSRKRLC